MSKEIAVLVNSVKEWKKTIDIFYKMGYCFHNVYDSPIKTKQYFEKWFDEKQENIITANYLIENNSIVWGYNTRNHHNCYTFSQFVAKYNNEEELE